MSSDIETLGRSSHMEPLLPEQKRGELAELSKELLLQIGGISKQVHSPLVRTKIAAVIREMNCYYSNLIEGHKTVPRDIERALNNDYSSDPTKRNNQKLSKAHISAENAMLDKLRNENVDVYTPQFICWLHKTFYSGLPEEMHYAETIDGKAYKIEPGELRNYLVKVGKHIPPDPQFLEGLLNRFCKFYCGNRIYETNRLVAIAAAHHRLAWIHPFGDGNGRVMRLYSHALLTYHKLDGEGLWTLSRGLARYRNKYYDLLENADQARRSDIDGRGHLSDKALADFCVFFLETMLDQVDFMGEKLELPTLRKRIEKHFQFEMLHLGTNAELLMKIVRALVDEGEFARAKVQEITGLSETSCRPIIKLGLEQSLFTSPNPRGKLQISFPSTVLESYFPKLFLDLEAE